MGTGSSSSSDYSEARTKSKPFLPSDKGVEVADDRTEDSTAIPEIRKTKAGSSAKKKTLKKKTPIRKKTEVTKKSTVRKKTPKRKKESIRVVTLVFFSLETTGLASEIAKPDVQITEVSMVAIGRNEFEKSTTEGLQDIRIIQKLRFCTRPRSRVSYGAAEVSGLNNINLIDQTPFGRNAAESINIFLSHLPKPVCLLAHYGNAYSFPLLKAEFSRLSMSLPSDILIADTLKAIRAVGVPEIPPEEISYSVRFTKGGNLSHSLPNLVLYLLDEGPPKSQNSEGKCFALAKVCHRMKDLLLLWFDSHHTTFDSVKQMW